MAHNQAMLVDMGSTSAATQVVTDVQAGTLWGVSMGTTSLAAAYGSRALVSATDARMEALIDAADEAEIEMVMTLTGINSFTTRPDSEQFWSLLGAAEGL